MYSIMINFLLYSTASSCRCWRERDGLERGIKRERGKGQESGGPVVRAVQHAARPASQPTWRGAGEEWERSERGRERREDERERRREKKMAMITDALPPLVAASGLTTVASSARRLI
jgi:hypothetical protein